MLYAFLSPSLAQTQKKIPFFQMPTKNFLGWSKNFKISCTISHAFLRFFLDNRNEFIGESSWANADWTISENISKLFVCTPCWMRFKLVNNYERAEKRVSSFVGCFSVRCCWWYYCWLHQTFSHRKKAFFTCFVIGKFSPLFWMSWIRKKGKVFTGKKWFVLSCFGTIFSVCQFPALRSWN